MLRKRGGTVNKIVVWSLFDSGIGSYQKAIRKFFPNVKNFSIGIDKLHKKCESWSVFIKNAKAVQS